jgi:ribosome biogenesis GTPase
MSKELPIEDLGWDAFFETNRVKLGLESFPVARVIAEHRGVYKVKNSEGEYLAKITGKQMFDAKSREDFPAVGDWVAISKADEQQAVIRKVLPRRTVMKRKSSGSSEVQIIAANVDVAFAVESVDRDYNLNRLERYFAAARDGGIRPAVVLNKTDLISEGELGSKLAQIKSRFKNIDVISTSTLAGEGLDELKRYIAKGKTYCFLGSSGVGKSSLINRLLGDEILRTENIGTHSGRGKHVTTAREMYFLENDGIMIDNPGVREVGMTDTSVGIDNLFEEITVLARDCKFADCSHINEPGCAVLAASKAGTLDKDKYANYIRLSKEAEYFEMNELEKKEKGRQFGKFVKKAKKDLKNFGHKDY